MALSCVVAPLAALLTVAHSMGGAVELGVRLVSPSLTCVACMLIANASALALSGGALVRRRLRIAGVIALASPLIAFLAPPSEVGLVPAQILAGIASMVLTATWSLVVAGAVARMLPKTAGRLVLGGAVTFVVAAFAITFVPSIEHALAAAQQAPVLEQSERGAVSTATAALAFGSRALELVAGWGAAAVILLGCCLLLASLLRDRDR
jgi:hypothetical protein